MANYNKSFNFKNGLQVDNDNFIVNASGLVGIGSTIPSAHLDVVGNIVNTGEITAAGGIRGGRLYSSGVSTFHGDVGIGTTGGLTADPQNTSLLNAGIVTARAYFGDGSYLSNIVGFATTKLIVHQATGGGANSGLATDTPVGLGTNLADVQYDLLVGHDPENATYAAAPTVYGGIGFVANQGSLKATGIITAVSGFVGPGTSIINLNATNISQGTLNNDRIPVLESSKLPLLTRIGAGATLGISTGTLQLKYIDLTGAGSGALPQYQQQGIVTAYAFVGLHTGDVTGNLTGNADTATTLNGDSSVNTSGSIIALGGFVGSGVSFTSAGIGNTATPAGDLQVQASGTDNVDVFVTSENKIATVAIGKSSVLADNNAVIRFNNDAPGWIDSSVNRPNRLDIMNYSQGNINFISNPALVSGASSEGTFSWRRGANVNPTMVFDPKLGRLGIGGTIPEVPLDVTGVTTVRGNAFVSGTLSANALTLGSNLVGNLNGGVYSTDGSEVFIDKGTTDGGANSYVKINTLATAGVSTFVDVSATGGIGIATDPNNPINSQRYLTIGNTNFKHSQVIVGQDGRVGIKTDALYENCGVSVPETSAYFRAVGVGRTPASAADFGVAGNSPVVNHETDLISTRFMIPPTVTQSERGGLRSNENSATLPNGSLIFNSTHKQLQIYVDGWVGIATVDAAS